MLSRDAAYVSSNRVGMINNYRFLSEAETGMTVTFQGTANSREDAVSMAMKNSPKRARRMTSIFGI